MVKDGSGTTTLTGDNTYDGTTTVQHGTLIVKGKSTHGTRDYYIGWTNGDNGQLIISDGGSITAGSGLIGDGAGSSGTVTVTGHGTSWINGTFVSVGNRGTGTLTIADGGNVTVGNGLGAVYVARAAGSSATLNIGAAAGSAAAAAGTLTARQVEFGSGTGKIVFNHTETEYTFEPKIIGTGTLEHHAGTTILTGSNTYSGDTTVRRGTLIIKGASDQGAASYIIGAVSGDNGQLTISDGGSISNGSVSLGRYYGAKGAATVTGAGSIWTSSDMFVVGNAGTGTLTISGGGSVFANNSAIAYGMDSHGTATVTGAGSKWTATALTVGDVGAGVLTIAEGGSVSIGGGTGILRIARNGGSSGLLIIGAAENSTPTGAGTLEAGEVRFGDGSGKIVFNHNDAAYTFAPKIVSYGTLEHYAGTTILTGDSTFAQSAVIHGGALIIKGKNANGTSSKYIVGDVAGDSGSLVIADGGTLSNGAGNIGRNTGGTGTATVTGAGSSWSANNLYIGTSGTGTLTIADGGSVNSEVGVIGSIASAMGTVTVSGAGSSFTVSTGVNVGQAGTGTLTITDGGSVSSKNAIVGSSPGSTGTATVTGAGSVWNNNLNLSVGQSGTGTLTVAEGGSVRVDNGAGVIRIATYSGSSGTLNIGAAAGAAAAGAGSLGVNELRFGEGEGRLVFNHTDNAYSVWQKITGAGTLEHHAGGTRLEGDNSGFTGTARVLGGTLTVNGALGAATTVSGGGTLTGTGTIDAAVSIASGGTLAGAQGRTLNLKSLSLDEGAAILASLGTPDGSGPLFAVTGDLVLDGTLNIMDLGGLTAGIYSLASFGGTLTDNGLVIGTTPVGTSAADFQVQTSVTGKVNLVSTVGAELHFWDGGDAAQHDNRRIDGGTGVWRADGRSWTDASGTLNGPMKPAPAFAVFDGVGGAVTVDAGAGTVSATGLQFAVDGYSIVGNALTLAGSGGESIIRVGNGSAAGAGMTATIAAALTGQTRLVKTDLGTLVLTGANSYTGGTEVRGGTLVGSAVSIRGDLVNNGTVVFEEAGAATFAGSVSGSGTTVKRGAGVLTLTGNSNVNWHIAEGGLVASSERFTGDLVIDAGATMTFDVAQDGVYAGRVSGAGRVLFTGGGTLTLTGLASGYAGVTTASAGTLVADGHLAGHLNLGEGARLEGNGTLGSATLAGTIAPGHSIGRLTFTGDVTLAASSVYEVEVDAAGGSDLVTIGGKATLEGSRLSVLAGAGDYQEGTDYTILTAAGGVTGAFGEVTSNLAFLTPSLAYGDTAVTLTLTRNKTDFAAVAKTRNQRGVAAALGSLERTSPLYSAVVQLDEAGARDAFDQLSGEGHASLAGVLLDDARLVRDVILARSPAETGLWSTLLGTWSDTDGDGNASGARRSARGFQMGLDRAAGAHWRLGVSFGYLDRTVKTDRSFSAEVDSYSFGAYASGQYGRVSVTLGAVGSWHDVETRRPVGVGAIAETERVAYDAEAWQAFAELGWQATRRGLVLTPYVRVAHALLDVDGFREDGGAAALAADKSELEATVVEAGARARSAEPIALGGAELTLHGSASLRRAFGDITPEITARLAGTSGFRVAGAPIEKLAGSVSGGASVRLSERLGLDVTYAGQLLGRTRDHGVRASASWQF